MKIKITESQYNKLQEELIYEISSDKVMGAAKKMWQDKVGGNDQQENSRAKKLLHDYANRLVGLKLCNGEVRFTEVELISGNDGKAFNLVFMIGLTMDSDMSFNGKGYTGIFYNYSLDRFTVGTQLNGTQTPIDQFNQSSLSKFDARQLYKIAKHFNPDTRYVNYTREIPINVEE